MDNFSKRTTVSLIAAFMLLVLGWGLAIEWMGRPTEAPVRCDNHLVCTPVSRV